MNKRSQIIASIVSVGTIVVVAVVSLTMFGGSSKITTQADINSPAPGIVDLYFSPDQNTARVGSRVALAALIDSGQSPVLSVKFVARYDKNLIDYVGFQPNQNTVSNPSVDVDQNQGTITFSFQPIANLTSLNTLGFFEFKASRIGAGAIAFDQDFEPQVGVNGAILTPRTRDARVIIE